ncbi:hypothetical protein KIN20_014200 [Parelaphostrongylus tenuis]|uniref:Uncharacterized protein n=1 Tax=Parelaphostrongylus tenuis TaxID=148309 RepID=A0AAD5QP85_PARTN|nr:hypothetical protein KIN20_014200 [Parelaphostrongylus tenuis]
MSASARGLEGTLLRLLPKIDLACEMSVSEGYEAAAPQNRLRGIIGPINDEN